MVRAYVEQLLEQLTGIEKVTPDKDGDYPVRVNDSLLYVRLVGDSAAPVISVSATAVSGISGSPELLAKLNEINSGVRFARVFWAREQVIVASDLIGTTVDPEEFESACKAVATITDHFGPLLSTEFGGKVFAPEEKDAEPKPASRDDPGTGLYL